MRFSDTIAPTRRVPAFARRAATAVLPLGFLACFLTCVLAPGCGGGRRLRLERQMAWVAANPRAPSPVKQAVLGKKLQEGVRMTKDAVVASWGEPRDKLDLGGGDARWIYRKRQARNTGGVVIEYTLIFNRGYLTKVKQIERR
ncbi:MAG: hypothetical protein ACYS9X_23720 [Planctomycetota bacterium]|jgi:hypothetical protein